MGNLCGPGIPPEERAAIARSIQVDKGCQHGQDEENKILKLLLLGTGESGKSTIFKQMQILYEEGFSDIEKSTFRHVIRTNLVESMQALIAGAEKFGFPFKNRKSESAARCINNLDPLAADFWIQDIVQWVRQLWENEPAIAQVYAERARLQILDSTSYLFKNIDRIGPDNYVPTADDILRARLRTSGIVERKFKIQNVDFKFLDVGGQRNERRKWIHCFDGVTSVIFVAAISEYDQVLYEDESQNRLQEAIKEFEKICNNPFFDETAMILFLNKKDLFEDKIQKVNIKVCFPEYRGGQNYEECAEFMQKKFLDVNTGSKLIFPHFTCATDTQLVQKVFEACKLVILDNNLRKLGLA
jgi:guanine nucleotide-binding protein G(o) subunit alpha